MSGIAKNNPFLRNTCQRATCPFGPQDCREKCYKENITYQAVCERCRIQPEEERERNPRLPTYIGETSRTLFTRYQQHVADYKKLSSVGPTNMLREPDRTSWMWEHSIQVHGGPENYLRDFSFLPLDNTRDSFSRQFLEAVRINPVLEKGIHTSHQSKEIPIISLNRRGECFAPFEREKE